MKNFILNPTISPSDIDFRNKIGKERWTELKIEYINKHKYHCQGCGYPMTKNYKFFDLHVISGDINDIENVNYTLLCKACHITQHLDKATELNYVKLVNSFYSQEELINLGRKGNTEVKSKLNDNSIILLDKTPQEYVEELKKNTFNKNNKIKVILSSTFSWDKSKE